MRSFPDVLQQVSISHLKSSYYVLENLLKVFGHGHGFISQILTAHVQAIFLRMYRLRIRRAIRLENQYCHTVMGDPPSGQSRGFWTVSSPSAHM